MVLLALHPNISGLKLFSIKSVLSEINFYINMENWHTKVFFMLFRDNSISAPPIEFLIFFIISNLLHGIEFAFFDQHFFKIRVYYNIFSD